MTDENQNENGALKDQAVTALANQYLSNATLGEALSLVPFGTLVQLVQQQVLTQSQNEVGSMNEDQLKNLINASEQQPEASESDSEPEGEK